MSRIGNKPITVPEGVEVTLDNKMITVKGPKGTLTREITDPITVKIEKEESNEYYRSNSRYANKN